MTHYLKRWHSQTHTHLARGAPQAPQRGLTCRTRWSPPWWPGCCHWWDRSHTPSPWPPPCPLRLPPCVQETGASSPSRVSPSELGESAVERRRAAEERAGADTVQTNPLSAVHWTGNSMESLMGGCSSEAIDLTKVRSHARTHKCQLRCLPGTEWALLPEQRLKSRSCELHPSCLHSRIHAGQRLTARCRFKARWSSAVRIGVLHQINKQQRGRIKT